MSKSLQVAIHGANNLSVGKKDDPYAIVTLDFKNKSAHYKTEHKNNGGANVVWNETKIIDGFDSSVHEKLYVEVHDKETLADEPVAFAAIPLSQVLSDSNQSYRAKFDLFTPDEEQRGTITLTISVIEPGQGSPVNYDNSYEGAEQKGISQIDPQHKSRISSLLTKERAGDATAAAAAVAGAAAALNFFGNAFANKPTEP
ncbi:hypothetical protein BX616_006116 [Lobosporangium transversale]|uniref:C2 domain-containing protein n=1 Tax=Lobosporangium transversale TaxID=64571 RepID=A0A1Y2GA43_9FUNG|nr:C2 domain-containing protein [Lobosporangium transversale]KAF9918742.1 hypothetical protein BX616_006116 [Lobosporangium transversale]ORZ00055.1 C2 domain-containing protein [Lobosporangium transversale]|eukprot:XP_021876096.1 C2 domain-containing protein [Lobosporangium transversale]